MTTDEVLWLIAGLIVGLFTGTNFGIFLMCLFIVSKGPRAPVEVE